MTEAAGKQFNPELKAWFEAWETCTQTVLSQIFGHAVTFETPSEAPPGADSDLWYTVVAGGALRGEMTLRLPAASGTRLAQKFLQETEPPPEPSAQHKEALEELLRQIAGQAATALASAAGGEVQFHVAASAAPSWSSSAATCLYTRDEAGTPVTIEIQISAALAAALQPRAEAQPASAPAPPPPAPAAASYERLRDVVLDVKLRFGSRRMLLRDVLALSAGVVVELDNNLNSPVDLLLDGRVVAQGEVVVVDGNYGLRVTHVLDSLPPS